MNRSKMTNGAVERFRCPEGKGSDVLWDGEVRGFGMLEGTDPVRRQSIGRVRKARRQQSRGKKGHTDQPVCRTEYLGGVAGGDVVHARLTNSYGQCGPAGLPETGGHSGDVELAEVHSQDTTPSGLNPWRATVRPTCRSSAGELPQGLMGRDHGGSLIRISPELLYFPIPPS